MFAACLATTLSACEASNSVTRFVPGPPSYAQPVHVDEPRVDEACVVYAGRERAGRLTANKIIRAVTGEWSSMSETYANGK